MRLIVAASLIHLILIASATTPISPDEARENFDREFKNQLREDDPRKQGIAKALQIYAGCKEKKWSCQKPCRAQIPLKGNDSVPYCTTPHPDETCFGLPINYMYVSSRDHLPAEYEVLRRFPKCWSVLGPTLCGIIYRPCGVYEFSARLSSNMHKMEIWQRFGISMCRRVHNECEDAIKEGFFPSELIDCKRTVENVTWAKEKTNAKGALARFVPNGNEEELKTEWDRQTVFTEEACYLNYGESASNFEEMQCIFPLVHTMHETIKPIIDKCFLPCRNPLISSPDKFLSFRITRSVICFFFALVCLAIFLFLSSRSKIFVDSHCIFSIACCFLSFAVYLICWGLGSVSYFSEAAECMRTVHNVLIRTTLESTWCSISAVVSHVSLLASIGFLAAAFPLSAAGASKVVERIKQQKEEEMGDKSAAGFRAKLVLLIVTVSIAIGLIALVLELVATDGVAGVCFVGLHSLFHHLMVIAFPGLFFCLMGLLWGAFDIWKEKRQMRMEIEQMIEDKIREGIDHEKAKKKIEFWTDRGGQQKEDMQEQVRQGSLPPLEEREGESNGGAGGEEIERDGEKEILVLIGDDDDKEWITDAQKKEIADAMRMEHAEDWRARERVAWYDSISSRYTLVAICLCIVSLIFGLCVHYTFLANDGTAEQDAIRSYVTCVMSKSIVRKDLHWMSNPVHSAEMWNGGAGENDPLARRHNLASEVVIHSCQYPSTGDGRIVGLLTVFIGLPLLPICVFIWAFFAGIIGVGGMVMVKARRPKKMKSSGATDVEMTAFTTERDEDSQIISSVASSIGGRVFPSSTLSTALSSSSITSSSPSVAPSVVSSAHSSVSLRGALPRFSSAERLMTVRATSPVPSAARSEQAAVPDRRSRSVGHHRVLDVMSRARERRERGNKKTKKRATSEEMNARREGVAESGQLVAPRNATDADCARSTASTHSAGSRGLFSTVSSTMVPPSEVCRRVLKNAVVHMGRSRQINRGTDLQRQLQIVQEELLLGAPSRNQENDEERAESEGNSELQKLSAIRDGIRLYVEDPLHATTAQSGMLASGLAITLARTAIANNLFDMDANKQILLFASRQLQYLAFHLEENLKLSPETAQDIAAAVNMLQMQIQFNNAPNAREVLLGQRIENINLGFEELDNLRQDFYRAVGDDERRAEIMNAMTEATRRHYIFRVMARREQHDQQRLQMQQQQQPAASIQMQPQNGNNGNGASVGRPPVYSPMQRIDLRLPPAGVNSARSEISFSVGGSSVPSSCMSPDEEDDQIKLYKELHRQPPMYVGPSTSADAAAPAADAAQTESSGVHEFMSQVMQMNNRSTQPPAYALQTAHFEVPTRSELGTDSVVSDVMSSETSIDSMDRRTTQSAAFSSGSYSVPVYDVLPERRAEVAPASNEFRTNGLQSALARLNSGVLPQVPRFPNSRPLGMPTVNNGDNAEHSMEHARQQLDRLNLVEVPNGEVGKKKKERKRKALPLEEPTTSTFNFGNANGPPKRDPPQPPPSVNRMEVVSREGDNTAAAELEARGSGTREQLEEGEDDSDSGVESLDSLTQLNLRLYVEEMEGSEGGMRPATKEELERYAKTVQRQIEERLIRRGDLERDEAGPSNDRRRMDRAHLMNRYMNHSDPDLAMEEEERERREAENEEREMEERRRVAEARAQQRDREREARVGRDNEEEEDEDSISSTLTAEEQRELVLALRDSLAHRLTDDMEPRHQRMVAHMRRAIDEHGSISREEIMRFRVEETNLENRARQNPDRNSPYSVSSVVISRMSLGEIGARADAIRALSSTNIYPLEVYYQLHLADVLWPLAGRDVMMGDNVYTHDEINRVLGADSPAVPAGADSNDFHQLMRKRAITAASLTGRAYGRKRGSEGFQYQPPRLPDQGVYQLLGDPSVILSAIDGDMEPLREAIDRIPMTMPDVMRLDLRTEQTLGSHLRHFRDYLDSRARMVGYELREDTYQDLVPPEPTGSRRTPRDTNDNTNGEDENENDAVNDDNDADPDF